MERDDIIEYSLDAHHSEEQGVLLRKKIWKVTAFIKQGTSIWPLVKWSFIGLTLVKAAYIVLSFMHLGDERKVLRYFILVPYFLFVIYLIFILLTEGMYVDNVLKSHGG
jgi:cytochrome c oxidase subunit IV